MKNKKLISLVLLICLAIGATACSNNKTDGSKASIDQEGVLAVVNGKSITQQEYDETLATFKKMVEAQYGEGSWDMEISAGQTLGSYYENGAVIDNMILEIVLVDAAEKEGITFTDDEMKTELEKYKGYFASEDEYKNYLTTNGMTEDYLKKAIKKQSIIDKYLAAHITNLTPTTEELQKIFTDKKMGEQVRASHILVATEEEANKVIERLNKGEAFDVVAKEVSTDTVSAANGGDLDFFSYSDMVEPFSKAAFSMEIGQVSGAVKTDYGYHIIKVTDKKVDSAVTVESEKEQLNELYQSVKYDELITRLKSEANIQRK
jgi:foldase protein PrsA